jgi:hypothetical protein
MISQPMKGKEREQILAERKRAVKYLESQNYKVIDTVFTDYAKTHSPLQCLAKSIETLSEMDLVYFLKGWEKARGCRIEYLCCIDYGISTQEEYEGNYEDYQ